MSHFFENFTGKIIEQTFLNKWGSKFNVTVIAGNDFRFDHAIHVEIIDFFIIKPEFDRFIGFKKVYYRVPVGLVFALLMMFSMLLLGRTLMANR